MTSTRSNGRRALVAATATAALALAAVAAYLLLTARLPDDAPLARMYRTEADLAALCKAVDVYHEAFGVFPPAGPAGLRLATDYLSRNVNYLPEGPPPDGWGRPYHYVPHPEYARPGSVAAPSDAGGYCAPGAYQIYSVGADEDAGLDDASKRTDNIVNWDSTKSWRNTYRILNEAYLSGAAPDRRR